MGHRALIAYQRPDQGFVLHYSHWGAHALELQNRITEETPFGGENDLEPPYLLAFTEALTGAVADEAGEEPAVGGRIVQAQEATAIDREPVAVQASLTGVMDELDNAAYEAVYFVDPRPDDDWHVLGYHVLNDLFGQRLLWAPKWSMDDSEPQTLSYDKGWFRGAKSACKHLDDADVPVDGPNAHLVQMAVERAADSLDKTIHPLSPALGEAGAIDGWWREYPEAFVRTGGQSRVLGEMFPTRVEDHADFEHPEAFPGVKTASGERVSP